jgi:hypothetical protein
LRATAEVVADGQRADSGVKLKPGGYVQAVLTIGPLPEVALDDMIFDVDALEREIEDEPD